MTDLLATKLRCPSLPTKRIQRPIINQLFTEALELGHKTILVSAPAGFGKTTAVSEWLTTQDKKFVWLTLDAADDDPGRFFTYLIAALQQYYELIGQDIEGILRAGRLPPEEVIINTIFNDLLKLEQSFLLVLDDFQFIQDESILRIISQLITNPPPTFNLVMITREDPPLPLARLRANTQLTEIRASDLRFTFNETNQYLTEIMKIGISHDEIIELEKKTEGWAAGLHLVGLSMRGLDHPEQFINKLNGNHRFILNYLSEEVINQLSSELQLFLLQTSILEHLNGDLCNAVTERTDSHEQLERLVTNNLFLMPLDATHHWYRFHQLFRDLLQDQLRRLPIKQIQSLHKRASAWYEQAGMINESIIHAIAGSDYNTAVTLIERHAFDMLMQWHLKTVEGWMKSIPEEWIKQSPRANLAFGWYHLMRGNFEQAMPYITLLGKMPTDQQTSTPIIITDPALKARWLALQAMLYGSRGEHSESLKACEQALAFCNEDDEQLLTMIQLGIATAHQQLNNYDQSLAAYQKLIQLGQNTRYSIAKLQGISGLTLLALQHGQYHFAFEIASQGLSFITTSNYLPPISTAIYGEIAVVYYQWHQLEKAHNYFQRAIQLSKLSGYNDAELYYGVILSRLAQIQGNTDKAIKTIEKTVELMHVTAPATVQNEVVAQQIRIYLSQDDLVSAERVLIQNGFPLYEITTPQNKPTPISPNVFYKYAQSSSDLLLAISALRIILYRAQIKQDKNILENGFQLANILIENVCKQDFVPLAIEISLLRAQMYSAEGKREASYADYSLALSLGEKENIITIFLEEGNYVAKDISEMLASNYKNHLDTQYIKRILAAFPNPNHEISNMSPTKVDSFEENTLVEPLTTRELEILQLIETGLSNQDITKHLFITLHTVKKHSSNIYAKLGVNNRTQAVARARKLGLL